MQRILCAIDLSEASDEALRQADELARSTGAALAVCHVIPNVQGVHPLFPQRHLDEALGAPELARDARTAMDERVASITGRGPDELEVFVEHGTGYVDIIRRAEIWRADLVVAASLGRTGLARILLGSVASQLVRYAHCPVLVARPPAGPAGPAGHGVVLAATDLSDAALPAVEAAAAEAVRRKAKLVVVHVLDITPPSSLWALGSPFGMAYAAPSAETLVEVHKAARVTLESALARFGATGETAIVDGEAAVAILREADARNAQLIVVGTRGRTGLTRVALGSVAEKVIERASSSVLAVRLGPP